jgi:hypothetical protein
MSKRQPKRKVPMSIGCPMYNQRLAPNTCMGCWYYQGTTLNFEVKCDYPTE